MTVPVALARDRSQDASVAAERPSQTATKCPEQEPTNEEAISTAMTFVENVLVPRYLSGGALNAEAFRDLLIKYLSVNREEGRHPIGLTGTVVETVLLTQVLIWRGLERLHPGSSARSQTYLQILTDCFGDEADASPR